MSETFAIGERVRKNHETWVASEFDSWGRGEGVGIIVEPPFDLGSEVVDVRWPAGRCFEAMTGLVHVGSAPEVPIA